jgi:hypothetical protein
MAWDVLKYDLVQKYGDRIEIAREHISAHAQRFEWNSPTASERIED